MTHVLSALGRLAARRPRAVVAAWLVVAAAVLVAAGVAGRGFDDGFAVPGGDSHRAAALLERSGAQAAGLTARVVVTPRGGATFTETPPARRAADGLRARFAALPRVLTVSSPVISPDGRVAVLRLRYPPMGDLDASDLRRLKFAVAAARTAAPGRELTIEAGGDLFFAFEEPETGLGEVAGVAIAAVVLLVAFGSVVAAGLPILLALFGLAVGVGALPLVAHLIDVPTWSPMMAAMVGLGVGIDYALLLVARHREHLAAGMGMPESIALAVATAGRTVVFAGGTVVVAILGLAVAGLPFLTAAGVAISVTVLTLVAASVTLLPALLALAGPRIDRLRVGRRRPARTGTPRWDRWAAHVARHARAYALGAAAMLVLAAAPAGALRLGMPDDGTRPESRTERRAYDLVAQGFGPGANGPFVIAVAFGPGDRAVPDAVRRAVAADPGVASVEAPEVVGGGGVAAVVAVPTTAPQAEETMRTLRRLRAEVLPAAVAGTGARAHVGGQTAVLADAGQRVTDRLPLFIGVVVALSLLLLVVVFRSVVVPVKAALVNLLSVGASYGVLVMVFQWGWGASLIGVDEPLPIVAFLPMFMFAILFGLSMDYEVFLLSRIREHHLATGDTGVAVRRGLASTGRVITCGALIMTAVFLGFVAGADPATKMFGLGLATAVAVDATIVRMVLVPAAMTILGDANWWLPRPLRRLLPPPAPAAGRATPP